MSSGKFVIFFTEICDATRQKTLHKGSSFVFRHYDTACCNILHCNKDQLSKVIQKNQLDATIIY